MKKSMKLSSPTVEKWGVEFTSLNRVFPSEKYKKYLDEFGTIDENKLGVKSIEQLFLTIRIDFVKGRLDLTTIIPH
jgi:hypothetical protein